MADSDQLDLEAAIEEAEEADLEKERDAVLAAVSASRLDTLQKRVAWVLNHYPDARDSDVALYIRYWREFEGEHVEGEYVKLKNITV